MSENQKPAPDLEALEKRYPKLGSLMRRIYRWRVFYGIAGFLSGIIKSIIEIVIGSQN